MAKKKIRGLPLPPLLLKAEKIGLKHKANEVPGKYLVGYKLSRKVMSETRQWFIELGRTAEESREWYHKYFQTDWENPYTFSW